MLSEKKTGKIMKKTVNTAWVAGVTGAMDTNPHEEQEKPDDFVAKLENEESNIINDLYSAHFRPKTDYLES